MARRAQSTPSSRLGSCNPWGYPKQQSIRRRPSTNAVSKTGYIQKEIREALEIADRMPEGRVFIIPVRLEPCEVPDRLQQWQWIDLYTSRGYQKLTASLEKHAGIHRSKARASAVRATSTFDSPRDQLLYDSFVRSGRFIYSRVPGRGYAVSQEHFPIFRNRLPTAFRELRGKIGDFRRLDPDQITSFIPKSALRRRDERLVYKFGYCEEQESLPSQQ
jgi:hypothetical protein